MNTISEPVTCKICGSKNLIRFGYYHQIQRWRCKDCSHKFANNGALPGMKIPYDVVAVTVGGHYEGRSLSSLPGMIYQLYGSFVTKASVYKWVMRFSRIAVSEAHKVKVSVGDTWIAYEKSTKIGNKRRWIIDVIDYDTKFLLATKISEGRSISDIRQVMEAARKKALNVPKQILTDNWKGYPDGVELAFGSDVKVVPFSNRDDFMRFIESWHKTIKVRTKLMKRMKNRDHADLILNGWLVHYNYFTLDETLTGRTPAETAKANFEFYNWSDLVLKSKLTPTFQNS